MEELMDTQLRTFLTVCETMNFTQAARKLFLTQPAVSQHIHTLEKKYGLPLFAHRGRNLELTPAGKTLAAYARLLQTDEALLVRKMEACQQGVHRLTFGVTLTIGEYGIARPAAQYLKAHPEVELTLIFGNTRELLQQLDRGTLDFALVEGYYPPESYDHLLFRLEPFVPVCAARHQFAREPQLCRDLLPERLLVREPGSGTRNILERNLALQGITLDQFAHRAQVGNMHALIQLLEEDCGITFLYRIAVEKEAAAGRVRLLPLKDFSMVHPFDFIWPKDSLFAPEIRVICQELMESKGNSPYSSLTRRL
jgi:DNA-binding transcriptional LysR family regulator